MSLKISHPACDIKKLNFSATHMCHYCTELSPRFCVVRTHTSNRADRATTEQSKSPNIGTLQQDRPTGPRPPHALHSLPPPVTGCHLFAFSPHLTYLHCRSIRPADGGDLFTTMVRLVPLRCFFFFSDRESARTGREKKKKFWREMKPGGA